MHCFNHSTLCSLNPVHSLQRIVKLFLDITFSSSEIKKPHSTEPAGFPCQKKKKKKKEIKKVFFFPFFVFGEKKEALMHNTAPSGMSSCI